LKQSISFAFDISQAMEYLHANDIISRDLKSCNEVFICILFSFDVYHSCIFILFDILSTTR